MQARLIPSWSFVFALAVAAYAGPPESGPPLSFSGPQVLYEGELDQIAIGDFDGDSIPDFAAAIGSGIRVYLRDADGNPTLVLPSYALGTLPTALITTDLDSDGVLDLVGCNRTQADNVVALIGNGDGTFTVGSTSTVDQAMDLVAEDFDGDGHVDVGVASATDGLVLLLGYGDGTFAAPSAIATGGSGSRSLASGDFDGDGNADVVVANEDSSDVTTLLGVGDGSFEPPTTRATAGSPYEILVADFDNDTHLDYVVSQTGTPNAIELALGTGSGTFGLHVAYAIGIELEEIVVADFDRDGFADVFGAHVLPTAPFKQITWLRGDGSGGLEAPRNFLTERRFQVALESADVDLDGRPDVVVLQHESFFNPTISVHFGGGPNGLLEVARTQTGDDPFSLAVGDFIEDGSPDIVTANQGTSDLSVLGNDGSGQLGEGSRPSVPGVPSSIASGDFNEDGHLDVVVTLGITISPSVLATYTGDGAGGLTAGPTTPVGPRPEWVAVADLNADGHLDAVVADETNELPVRLGVGDGSFTPAASLSLGRTPRGLAIAQLDSSDAHLDVVVTSSPGWVSIFSGVGDGTFVLAAEVDLGDEPGRVTTADLNGDGNVDLLVALPIADELAVMLGKGVGGGFRLLDKIEVGEEPVHVASGDFDEDGNVDVAVVLKEDDRIQIFRGRGDGTLELRTELSAVFSPRSSVVADFDGDSHLDVATGLQSERVYVHRNRTFDGVRCRRGNVDAANGTPVDVLFVNDSAGDGAERVVRLAKDDPLEIRMAAPPSRPAGPSRFVAYALLHEPSDSTVVPLPFELGHFCRSIPPVAPSSPGLKRTWNNIGRTGLLGVPDVSSDPAPSTLLVLPNGIGQPVTVTLQGLILDGGSPNGIAAVTNAVVVETL